MDATPAQPRSRTATVVGLLVALGSPFLLPLIPGQAHQDIANAGQDAVVLVFEWIVAIAILAIVVFWERLPLGSIGFRVPTWGDALAAGATVAGLLLALAVFSTAAHLRSGPAGTTVAQILALPLALRIAIFVTGGFCEELMFRGYAIERLARFAGKRWIGGTIVVVLFTLGHLPRYGFSLALVDVGIIAVFLTGLYLWRRNFWICAIVHAAIDAFGLVVAPLLAQGH